MTLVLLNEDTDAQVIARVPQGEARREHTLRDLIHDQPSTMPVHDIDPSYGRLSRAATCGSRLRSADWCRRVVSGASPGIMPPLEVIAAKRAHLDRLANQSGAAGEQDLVLAMDAWIPRPKGPRLKLLLDALSEVGKAIRASSFDAAAVLRA